MHQAKDLEMMSEVSGSLRDVRLILAEIRQELRRAKRRALLQAIGLLAAVTAGAAALAVLL